MAWRPDYADPTQLQGYVRISDAMDDAELGLALTAASRAIDSAANRQFGKVDTAVTRYYTARFNASRGRYVVEIDDLMDDTGVVVMSDGDEITEYVLTPRNAEADGLPWTRLEVPADATVTPTCAPDGVAVTAVFGWSAVPDTIVQATLLQASRFVFRRDAPAGVAGSPDQGSELRLLDRVDPDVSVMLSAYRRSAIRVG